MSVDGTTHATPHTFGSVVGVVRGDCTVTTVANGQRVDWEPIPGETRWGVRRNGSWIRTVVNATQFVDTAGDGNDTYVIRYDLDDGAGRQTLTCDRGGTPPPPDNVCFVTTRAAGGVTITWQNKPGTEVLRSGGSWVATPPAGTLTYNAPNGRLNDGWVIRRDVVNIETCQVLG